MGGIIMSKRHLCFLSIFVGLFTFTSLVLGHVETVFGPKNCDISPWHLHLSHHTFQADDPGEGILVIKKTTPEKEISGAFLFLNETFVPLRQFLETDDLIFYKDISLKSTNRLIVFLRGTPGASVSIEIRQSDGPVPPPTVTLLSDPTTITVGEVATLSWQTTDADLVFLDHGIGEVSLSGCEVVTPQESTAYTITAFGRGGSTTETVTVTVSPLSPGVEMSAEPETILLGESATLSWTSSNASSCVIEPDIGTVDPTGAKTVSPTETTTYTITATGAGGVAVESVTIQVDDSPAGPTVTLGATPTSITQGELATLSWVSANGQDAHIDQGIGVVPVNGSTVVSPDHTTTYTITVTGSAGSASFQATVSVTGNPEHPPEGSFGEQYEDLIPPDATVESYDPKRFSLITGLVKDVSGSPIAHVSVTIHDHPEYGTVKTDTDGRFSIPVEGGATTTVSYQMDGFLPSQRKVYVPWNDTAITETVVMVTQDPAATIVTFDGNPHTVVTHQSTEVIDDFGSRPVLWFSQETIMPIWWMKMATMCMN